MAGRWNHLEASSFIPVRVEAGCQLDLAELLPRIPLCGLSTWSLHVGSFGLPLSMMAGFQAHLKRAGHTYL